MKKLQTILFLLIVFASGGVQVSAATFDVNQNIVNLSAIPNCSSPSLVSYNSQSQNGTVVASMRVDVNHNINGIPYGSPNLPQTLNGQAFRKVNFKIFPAVNGSPTSRLPEATITKSDQWLHGAATHNGSSSTQYDLTVADLNAANLSAGNKIIYLEVTYQYFGNTPHTLNLNVSLNGTPTWSKPNFDVAGTTVVCAQPSLIGCFNYYPCNGNLSILGSIQQIQAPWGWVNLYDYNSFMTGGSGNYSYEWTLNNSSNVGTNPSFSFIGSPSLNLVTLTVTDNTTGCIYVVSQSLKKGESAEVTSPTLTMTVGPNPSHVNSPLKVEYQLSEADAVDFAIYDLSGRKVLDLGQQVDSNMGSNSIELTPTNLGSGIYFVRMSSAKNGTRMQKIILNN